MQYQIEPDIGRVTTSVIVAASYILDGDKLKGVVCVGKRNTNGSTDVIQAFAGDDGYDIWTKILGEDEAGKYADELEKARKESLKRGASHEGA